MDIPLFNRLNTAVEFLRDGMSFNVGDYVLGVINAETIFVNIYSDYAMVQNLNRDIAKQEFYRKKSSFITLMNDAKIFNNYVKDKSIDFFLVVDTGNAGINICKEKGGVLEFYI